MQHTNARQCLDSIRTRLEYLETEVIKRDNNSCALRDKIASKNDDIAKLLETATALRRDIVTLQNRLAKASLPDKPELSIESVHTTELFWDCNCKKNYINHSYITKCEICGAHKVDQPDSRLEELGMARLAGINEIAERYARSNK